MIPRFSSAVPVSDEPISGRLHCPIELQRAGRRGDARLLHTQRYPHSTASETPVEYWHRKSGLGPDREGSLITRQICTLPNGLGKILLTDTGALEHLVNGRARRLSGSHKIQSFALTDTGHLLAVDSKRNLLVFDHEKWKQAPVAAAAKDVGKVGVGPSIVVRKVLGVPSEN